MGCRFQFCGDIQELLLPLHSVRGLALFISFYREFGSTYMFLLLFPSVSQLICCYYFEKILISLWVACRYLIFSSSFWPLWSILWILNGPRQDGQLFYSYLDGCSEFFLFFFLVGIYCTCLLTLLIFVGPQMMELVESGMLDIPNIVLEYTCPSLQMLSLVRWFFFVVFCLLVCIRKILKFL